jgi:nitrogen fixation NifU-like protein
MENREHILDHYENPRHTGTLDPADIDCERSSPLCGDRIHVYVRLDSVHIHAAEAVFDGDGCIISQAAASMLMEQINGMPLAEIEAFQPERMLALIGIPLSAQRVKCALLGLQTVKDGIREWRLRSADETPATA